MKKNKSLTLIFILSFLLPLYLFAQQEQDISGLWKGTLYEDSPKQAISYQLAITNDNGKLSGYSYALFKGDKGDEVGIKRIKIKRKDDNIIIEDVDLIDNSYSVAPSKKVRKLIVLTLTIKDSILIMSGKWKTNWTKQYHPVTGTIEVQRKNDSWKDEPLMKKLDSMKLSNKLSFNPPEKKENPVAVVKPKETIAVPQKTTDVAVAEKPHKKEKKVIPPIEASIDSSRVATITKPPKKEKKAEAPVAVKEKKTEIKKTEPVVIPAAAEAEKRKTQTIQSVFFKTDSLVLTLYDNGVVDGDTVSVLMNGSLVFSKQGLSEKPVSKTVYTKNIPDSLLLVMYAENLGTIPPNTGLLVIYDGKTRYEVFFSADLQNNAAIILRRKKDE